MRPVDAALDRDLADADLAHSAEQYAAVVALARSGDGTPELVRARRESLQRAAMQWAASSGWARRLNR